MSPTIPKTMRAVVIDKYGGPEELHVATIPVPAVEEWDVLIQVETAGIGSWDPWIVEGGLGSGGVFPLVLGSDGSGKVVAVGPMVKRVKVGDLVYGYAFGNPKGGFYAEYVCLHEGNLALIPKNVSLEEAGALGASGVTALIGLLQLDLINEQKMIIYGASGGVGHVALQLAKLMGAEVLAVASSKDGVQLAKRLGADISIDGRTENVSEAVRKFAPDGLDAAMFFITGPDLDKIQEQVKDGGKIAYPNGVEPEPKGREEVKVIAFDGVPSQEIFDHLNELIETGKFTVEISKLYDMKDLGQAMKDVQKHHLGKLALRVGIGSKEKGAEKIKVKSG
ncbi:MAG TPA: NADP-dependent oxidoreductase [Methanomassiliicoccales archaeon]|jgi:NADPH:quinone reductase-like Zn-dependent oxidoreductase